MPVANPGSQSLTNSYGGIDGVKRDLNGHLTKEFY